MTTQEVSFAFPEGATDRDKVAVLLDYPYSFACLCRSKVGFAPDCNDNYGHGCVVEEYIEEMAGTFWSVTSLHIQSCRQPYEEVVTPIWVTRVIEYVDAGQHLLTYLDVANFVVDALNRGEIA